MEKVLKIFALAAFVVFVAASSAVQSGNKIAYINSASIMAELPQVKSAQADLEVMQNQLQKKGEKMVEDYKATEREIVQKVQAGQMSPQQQEAEGKRLQDKQQEIAAFDQKMREDLAKKQQELFEPLQIKMQSAVDAVGKEGSYSMVFDISVPGVIIYADEATDISSAVKAKL